MCGYKKIVFSVTVLACLSLLGCSMEPGGSEDPEAFKTTLTPLDESAPAVFGAETTVSEAKDTVATKGQDGLEQRFEYALERIGRIEMALAEIQLSIASIQQTADQALAKAQEGPLAGVNLDNNKEVGNALMKQSLEQIMGISRLLLEKMESKLAEPEAEPTSESKPQLQ